MSARLDVPKTMTKGLATDREPWSRQPHETENAFAAFILFRDQTPPRSIVRLADDLGRVKAQQYYRWSSQWNWPSRVNAWDGYYQQERDRISIAEAREMNARHAMLAKAMSAKVAARVQALDPTELSPGEVGRWMQVISMVERLARGEATERIDRNGPDVEVNLQVNAAEQQVVFDRAYVADVLDRLAARGVVPMPMLGAGDADSDAVGFTDAETTVEVLSEEAVDAVIAVVLDDDAGSRSEGAGDIGGSRGGGTPGPEAKGYNPLRHRHPNGS